MNGQEIWKSVQNFAGDEQGGGIETGEFYKIDPVQAFLLMAMVGTIGYSGFFYKPPSISADSPSSLAILLEPPGKNGCGFMGVAKTKENTIVVVNNGLLDGVPEGTFIRTSGPVNSDGKVVGDYVFAGLKKGRIGSDNLTDWQCFKTINWDGLETNVSFLASQTYDNQPAFVFGGSSRGKELIGIDGLKINLFIDNKMPNDLVIFPRRMGMWLDYLLPESITGDVNLDVVLLDCESMPHNGKQAVGLMVKFGDNNYELRLAGRFLKHTSREEAIEIGNHELGHFASFEIGGSKEDHGISGEFVNLAVLAQGTNFPGPIFVVN